MSDQTAKGFTYPEGTDDAATLDTTIQTLAEEVDETVGRHAAGGPVAHNYVSGTGSVPVSFPAGRFTTAPVVVCNVVVGLIGGLTNGHSTAWASNVTATGFDMQFRRSAAGAMEAVWVAVQVDA